MKDSDEKLTVFTTRVDTIYGTTFMVLAPEYPTVLENVKGTEYEQPVLEYIDKVKHMNEIERTSTSNEKTGVFIGKYAINPFTHKEMPIYIADYVLMGYGTGAVMGVPAHDQRDFDFATKFGIDSCGAGGWHYERTAGLRFHHGRLRGGGRGFRHYD